MSFLEQIMFVDNYPSLFSCHMYICCIVRQLSVYSYRRYQKQKQKNKMVTFSVCIPNVIIIH